MPSMCHERAGQSQAWVALTPDGGPQQMSACLDKRRERRHEISPDSPKGGLALTRVRSCKSLPLRRFEVSAGQLGPSPPTGGRVISKRWAVDSGSLGAWRLVGREPVGHNSRVAGNPGPIHSGAKAIRLKRVRPHAPSPRSAAGHNKIQSLIGRDDANEICLGTRHEVRS